MQFPPGTGIKRLHGAHPLGFPLVKLCLRNSCPSTGVLLKKPVGAENVVVFQLSANLCMYLNNGVRLGEAKFIGGTLT